MLRGDVKRANDPAATYDANSAFTAYLNSAPPSRLWRGPGDLGRGEIRDRAGPTVIFACLCLD